MCYPLLAVLFDDVPQHVRTSVLVEVHVHIGKGDAVRVQKAFEQQVVFKGVYVCYLQTVGDDGAGSRTAARSDRYAHFACGADEVRHNEEVARKAHPFDGAQFVPDTFERLLVRFAVPFLRPFHGKCHEVKVLFGYRQPFAEPFVAGGKRIEVVSGFCLCLFRPQPLHFVQEGGLFRFVGIGHLLFEAAYLAVETAQEYPAQLRLVDDEIVRQRKVGHQGLVFQRIMFDLVRYLHGIFQCFQVVGEKRRHFVRALEELLSRVAHAVRVVEVAPRIEAYQMVVRRSILFEGEVYVVRDDEFDAMPGGQVVQHLVHLYLMTARIGIRCAGE